MIDCDVHQNFNSLSELFPYLSAAHRDHIVNGGYGGLSLPSYPWTHPEGFLRRDASPPNGGVAGSDYDLLRAQLLDRYDIEFAILNGEDILNASCMASPQLAAALCQAYNDWVLEQWISLDERFRASIIVPTQDATAAAAEIRRIGDHPRVVQVLMPSGARAGYGHPQYHPIYEAAHELDLVVGIHAGGGGCGVLGPPSPTGWPVYYIEYHTIVATEFQSHLVSLIVHGVFERFPSLRVTIIEGGVCWLPALLWRLDADYKALRAEVPWVKRLPSEYVRNHMRLTTQPLERPARNADLRAILNVIGPDMLCYASDYPHWDFDNPEFLPLSADWTNRVFDANAREWYRLAAQEPAVAAALST
jgi:predicted TIM-barrel fold metal-dependent hydrolase